MSALDAAAEVLGRLAKRDAVTGMSVKILIERMEKAGLWKSAGGKTPDATLYSAIIREIKIRRSESRFRRVSPGKFTLAVDANKKGYSKKTESKR
ncbi:MAG: winged helix-turn-helix domain-containing protein [Phycisphaeraceae bacterium]|nr:winged helix-turn-helix domain-containing protein [Phycisphaeraceae bacterium]